MDGFTDGEYVANITALDQAGNRQALPQSVAWKVQLPLPVDLPTVSYVDGPASEYAFAHAILYNVTLSFRVTVAGAEPSGPSPSFPLEVNKGQGQGWSPAGQCSTSYCNYTVPMQPDLQEQLYQVQQHYSVQVSMERGGQGWCWWEGCCRM